MKVRHPGAIVIPKGLLAGKSAEVARIWITDQAGSTVLIDPSVLADPAVFGILMADTIRHGAKAYAQAGGSSEEAALQAIVNGVAAELRDQFNTVTPIERSN